MKKKKGFTLVELLVVIAILAVLATVSVVGYMGFTKKAKESNDASLTTQMNTALQANGVVKKNKTLTEAREDLLEAGIDLEKVTPTTDGYSYVWDSKQDLMFLLNENREVVAPTNATISENTVDSFVVVHNETEFNTWKSDYSLYFANGYESKQLILEKLVGIDAGTSGINNISVTDDTSNADVTMYTTSGTLTIDARQATVRHYGEAKTVSIKAIAGNSYHEYGTVTGNVEVTKGRVELENTADVNTVLVSSETSGDSKVDYNSGAKVGTVAPTTEAAKADVSSSTIPSESKQETIVDTTETSKFAGGLGTEKSPYLIEDGEQFANINQLSSDMELGKSYFFKQISDIVITSNCTNRFAGGYDGGNYQIEINFSKYIKDNYSAVFSASCITAHVSFKNINILMKDKPVTLLACADWGTSYGADFENITFNSTSDVTSCNVSNFGFLVINAIYTNGNNNPVYNFKNITNNVNLENTGTCTGVFIGSGPCFNVKTTLNFENCVNNGNITGADSVGYLYGNSAYIDSIEETDIVINVTNCINKGYMMGTKENCIVEFAPKLTELNEKYQNLCGGQYIKGNCLSNKKFTINQNGSDFTININDTSYEYKLALNINAIYFLKSGEKWTEDDVKTITPESWSEKWDVSNGTKHFIELSIDTNTTGDFNSFKAMDCVTAKNNGVIDSNFNAYNQDGFAIVIKNDINYVVFDVNENVYINSSVSLLVYAYTNGNLRGIKNI